MFPRRRCEPDFSNLSRCRDYDSFNLKLLEMLMTVVPRTEYDIAVEGRRDRIAQVSATSDVAWTLCLGVTTRFVGAER